MADLDKDVSLLIGADWRDDDTFPGVYPELGVDARDLSHVFGAGQNGAKVRTGEEDEVAYLDVEDVAQHTFLEAVEMRRRVEVDCGISGEIDSEVKGVLDDSAKGVTSALVEFLRSEGGALPIVKEMNRLVPIATPDRLTTYPKLPLIDQGR